MLIFIDESGDTGRKINRGSSRYFLVSIVLFSENEEAESCDRRISRLRIELRKSDNFEFHFTNNSHKVRLNFLKATKSYRFIYFSVVIDKNPRKLQGPEFRTKESFYKYVCQMVMTNALPYFDTATVVIDQCGSKSFRKNLARHLRSKIEKNQGKIIKKFGLMGNLCGYFLRKSS